MKSKNIVICDSESGYADRLAQWLLEKKEMNFQIHVMSDLRLAEKFAKEQEIHILIVDEESEEVRERLNPDHTIFLYRYAVKSKEQKNVRQIFKYQPADCIFKEILDICVQEEDPLCFRPTPRGKRQVLAVYPLPESLGKTTFAWEIACICARKGKTLYVSTDAYARLSVEREETGFSVSDVLYFAEQESCRIGVKVSAAALHAGEVQYLEPPLSREDVCGIGGKDWYQIVWRILEEGVYEYLVMEAGCMGAELFWFLERCQEVFVPCAQEGVSQKEMFVKDLQRTGYSGLAERIRWIDMESDWRGELVNIFQGGEERGET